MPELFDKHGGFRRLHSFTLATIVQLDTLRFCRRFLTSDPREAGEKFYDPKGRQYDQMTQAARSGRQNIIEGSERSSTSKDTEMKLTDVARASLSELRGDYEIFILDRRQLPWSVHDAEAKAVNAISLDEAPFTDDMVHESAKHALEQRKKYARWLDSEDAVVVANAMLIILGRVLKMLKRQKEAQVGQGGFLGMLHLPRLQRHEAGMRKTEGTDDRADHNDLIDHKVNRVNEVNEVSAMNESETRAEHIDSALAAAGWGVVEGSRIRREFPITPGRIEGLGRRGKPLTADYVLEYRNRKLAVVEAKAWDEALTEGVGQGKNYAGKLAIRFAARSAAGAARHRDRGRST